MQGRGKKKGPGVKPDNAIKTLLRIFTYMGNNKYLMIPVVIFVIISALTDVAGTAFLKTIIDQYLGPMMGGNNPELMAGFIKTLVVLLCVYLGGALSSFIYSRIMLKVSTTTLYRLRMELFTKMEKLPIRYFDTHQTGDLMSLYTNDIDTIREMLSNSVANFISASVTVVSVFIMMCIYSWQLTILVVIMLFVIIKTIGFIGSRSGKYFMKQQKALGVANGYIEEHINGQKVVKVFCHEEESKAEFSKLNEQLCEASTNANTFANILMPVMTNLSYVNYAITAVAGGILAINGHISLGTTVAFLQYTRNFSRPITQMSQQFNNLLSALAGAERIFKVIDEQPEEDDGYVTLVNANIDSDGKLTETPERTGIWAWKHPHQDGTVTYARVEGAVEMDDVTFGYEAEKTVLKDVTLYAKPGQKIAFVGSTGAGKTTITNLINRFYDVPEGKIRYDKININKIKKADLRRSMAMVLQDTHLFTGTVMENIRYGKLDATDAEVIHAAKLANADGFIRHLSKGYDTVLTGDGTNLSQGQRQLLSIARAVVADAPVLILDEATSSIDTRTEALVERGMDELMKGRTVFVIAHRLSTVRNANAIMVLEHGEIIERGDHDDLIAQEGKYYQLYTGMFELS